MSDESPGMLALQAGVLKQVLPHTIDAREWAKEFNATACKLGYQVMDEGWLVAWFANAIMAGYDTATLRLAADNAALRADLERHKAMLKGCIDDICHFEKEMEERHGMEFTDDYGGRWQGDVVTGYINALRLKVQEYNSALDAMTARYVVLEKLVKAIPPANNPYELVAIIEHGNETAYNNVAALLTRRQGMGG